MKNDSLSFESIMFWSNSKSLDKLTQWGAVEEMTGFTDQDFQENHTLWFDMIYEEDQDYFLGIIQKMNKYDEIEIPVEYRITRKDGSIRFLMGIVKKDVKLDTFYSGYLIDLSKRNNFRNTQTYRDSLVAHLSNSVYSLFDNSDTFSTSANRVLEQLSQLSMVDRIYIFKSKNMDNEHPMLDNVFEWCAEGIEPQKESDLVKNFDFAADSPRWFKSMVMHKAPVLGIVRLFPQEERAFLEPQHILSLLAVPIWINDQFFGFIGFDDCTEERTWMDDEVQLLSLYSNLIAASWTYHETKSALNDNISELVKIKKDREVFFSMLAHQFKTPLSIVDMNSQMIQMALKNMDSRNDLRTDQNFQRIYRATNQMKAYLDKILKGISSEIAVNTVNSLLPIQIMKDYLDQDETLKERVFIRSEMTGSDQVYIPLGQTQFEYILDTLLRNAYKYSSHTQDKIILDCLIEHQNLKLIVKDFGIGIHENEVEKIGQLFYRASNVQTIEGTGVGLSMVKSMLESVNGNFFIESEESNYTQVTIEIPLI